MTKNDKMTIMTKMTKNQQNFATVKTDVVSRSDKRQTLGKS